ncbi:MAG: dihydrofolate reductase, partial [Flavobacteriales bacterium]
GRQLPWKLPDDMAHFRHTTMGHHLVMGRRNYDSIPEKYRPLPGRVNMVVSRNAKLEISGCIVVQSIEEGIEFAREQNEQELFIIGGGEIYRHALPLVDKMYITHVHHSFEGDVFFPEIDYSDWILLDKQEHKADKNHAYSFSLSIYEKNKRK